MAFMDEPLDFENDDPLVSSPINSNNKRRKVIDLDDLLSDYYNDKQKVVENKSKKITISKGYNSDEEDDKTRMLSNVVNQCEKQVSKMVTEDDIPLWGQRLFGSQKSPPSLNLKGPANCELLRSFKKSEHNLLLDLNSEEGESILEGLLLNGWLSRLAISCGFVEDSVASWSFDILLYASNEELQVAACDFWCQVLLFKNEADQPLVKLEWFPTYSQLKVALEAYGYLNDASDISVPRAESIDTGCEGPPENIWSWVSIISACCQFRNIRTIFSTAEATELLSVVIALFSDRQLQGLSAVLNQCVESVINFFNDHEWDVSCEKLAYAVAQRISKDLNCVRVVECISGVSSRSKKLRSELALQMLVVSFNGNVTDGRAILKALMATNVKDKKCDFFKMYIYLVLVENWLLSHDKIDDREVVLDLWCKHLRSCSTQITSTDWRSYASKVRNKASYILQNSIH